MSASATSRVSLPDHINSYPQFSEKASRINALSSFEDVAIEADALVREFNASYEQARSRDNPRILDKTRTSRIKTNLMQVSVGFLWHKVVNLAASLIRSGEFRRNTRQFKLASKKVVELQDKIALNKRDTSNIPQIISSALMPVIKADSAALAYAVERTSILPIDHLQKLDTFLINFGEQIADLVNFLKDSRALPPELEPMINQFNDQLLVMRFASSDREEETLETPPNGFRVIPAAARSCISYLSNLSLVQRFSQSFFRRSTPQPSLQPHFMQSFLGDRRVKLECREPIHFQILQDFEKLAQRPLGRELIETVLSFHKKESPFLVHEIFASGARCFSSYGVLHLRGQQTYPYAVKIKGEDDLAESSTIFPLAHEMLHRLHYLEDSAKHNRMIDNKKGIPDPNYDNREEYYTITGFDLEVQHNGQYRTHKFSDNGIRRAFGVPERINHRGSSFLLKGPVDEITTNGSTRFHEAGDYGLVGTLRRLLEQAPSIELLNKKDRNGYTALHLFIDNQKTKGVELLIQSGADPRIQTNPRNRNAQPPQSDKLRFLENSLHLGVRTKDIEIVKTILSSNYLNSPEEMQSFVNTSNEDRHTPLFLAFKFSCHDIAILLLSKGAKGHHYTIRQEPIMLYAVRNGIIGICEELLRQEPDEARRKTLLNAINADGDSCLHLSIRNGLDAFTRLFLGAGANPHIANKKKETPMHLAARRGAKDVCIALTYSESDYAKSMAMFDCENEDGEIPLHLSVREGHPQMVELLLGCPDTMHYTISSKNKLGQNAMHLAAQRGAKSICEELLEQEPDSARRKALLNQTDNNGDSALHVSIRNGHSETAIFLLGAGSDPHLANKKKATPMHLAAIKGFKDVCEALMKSERSYIRRKAMLNAQTIGGESPLHFSVNERKPAVTELLVKSFASLSVQNSLGRTPLHYAVLRSLEDVRLIAGWAYFYEPIAIDLEDHEGRTALYYSVNKRNPEAAAILRSYEAGPEKGGRSPLAHAQSLDDDDPIRAKIIQLLEGPVRHESNPFDNPDLGFGVAFEQPTEEDELIV